MRIDWNATALLVALGSIAAYATAILFIPARPRQVGDIALMVGQFALKPDQLLRLDLRPSHKPAVKADVLVSSEGVVVGDEEHRHTPRFNPLDDRFIVDAGHGCGSRLRIRVLY